jgi:hypothetical protein
MVAMACAQEGEDRKRGPEAGTVGVDEPGVEFPATPAPGVHGIQAHFGNDEVQKALSGQGQEFGAVLRSVLTAEVSGNPAPVDLSSNASVASALGAGASQKPGVQQATSPPSSGGIEVLSPTPTAEGTSVGRPPDGLVDHYMGVHWDSTEFHALGHEVGYPGNLSPDTVGVVQMLLPADASPEVRAVVEVMCAAASGYLDQILVDQAADMLGLSGDFLNGLIDAGSTAASFVSLDDPVGLALFGGATAIEGVLLGLEAGLDQVAEVFAPLAELGYALSAAIWTIGQLPVAVATGLANAIGFATVEALVTELTAMGAAISTVLATVNGTLNALQVAIDLFRSALGVVQYMYDERQRTQAEAAGDFARAEQYRDLMRGQALSILQNWLDAMVHGVFMIPFASRARPGSLFGAIEPVVDAVADTQWWSDWTSSGWDTPLPLDAPDFADPMREPGVAPPSGADLGPLSAARQATIDELTTGYASTSGDAPHWHQALVNDIADPSLRPSFDEATSPTFWIGQLVQDMPMLGEFVADGSLEAIAAGCDLAADALPGTQPLFDAVALTLVDLKPQLDQVVVQLDAVVQQHRLDLGQLESVAAGLEQGLADLRALTDPTEGVHATADELVAQLESLRVDPARFALPPGSPVSLDSVLEPLNACVDAAITQIRAFEQSAVDAWNDTVGELIVAVEQEVARFRTEVSEEGSFHDALDAQVESFKASVARASEAFLEWDGVLELDVNTAVAFLHSTAEAARAAAEAEGPDGEGDPWPRILQEVAIPAIDAWRGRHAAEVEQQYHPSIPPGELAACDALQAEALADPGRSEDQKAAIRVAWTQVSSYAGQQGRDALLAFWSAEVGLVAALTQGDSA